MDAPKPASLGTNRLIDATSPYLLQHAHNPVDWYPWGPEALALARAADKPIFLSIGYSACHWCHVMAHESFEDAEIAAVLNDYFVSIKVDREERPDLDEIYMSATMLYNRGQGGWPMTLFLLPDGRPFFAGTYLPPRTARGRIGLLDLITEVARLWATERDGLVQAAEALTEGVRRFATVAPDSQLPDPGVIAAAAAGYARVFDSEYGGVLSGATNKFPPAMAMQLMLREYDRRIEAGEPAGDLLEHVERTLRHMARGGIYDHLAGGICRYSTDPQWHVPHFEKMLYDQALVADVYLDAYTLTRKADYARVAREILDFVLTDLRSPEGAFYSSLDADSEGYEGRYYVWTLDEVRQVLGARDAALFAAAYDVTETGNWRDRTGHAPPGPQNILRMRHPLVEVADCHGLSERELATVLERSRLTLLAVRRKRTPPHLDDKILTAWNGLMIASLAKASRALNEPRYRDAASKAADFILRTLERDGRLLRTCRGDRAHTDAYLDDYAFLIEGLLNLYEATFEPRWLDAAQRLAVAVRDRFYDQDGGAFFFTATDAEQSLVRTKDVGDSAVPGANSIHAMNLLRLAAIFDRSDLRGDAESIFRALGSRLRGSPFGFDRLLAALDFHHRGPREVAIVGPADDPRTQALVEAVWEHYLPNKVVVAIDPTQPDAAARASSVPLLRNRGMIAGGPTAFVCSRYVCREPATNPDILRRQLYPQSAGPGVELDPHGPSTAARHSAGLPQAARAGGKTGNTQR
ncbi:MAG: thioredoxin domain-containing protein [Phycisphaerae bacterium]|nr:thioredoxin domain-containing protein [Phycisphaerae bacterium]